VQVGATVECDAIAECKRARAELTRRAARCASDVRANAGDVMTPKASLNMIEERQALARTFKALRRDVPWSVFIGASSAAGLRVAGAALANASGFSTSSAGSASVRVRAPGRSVKPATDDASVASTSV
jgi:hypothetical protein